MVQMKKLVMPDPDGNENEFEIVDASARTRVNDHDAAIATKAEAADLNAAISNINEALAAEVSNRSTADNILSARMDEFTALTDGSTTGDAELADIRVGDDGVTYSTAGNAVRTQFANVKGDLETAFAYNTESLVSGDPLDGYINSSGELAGTEGNVRHFAIPVTADMVGKIILVTGSAWYSCIPWTFVGSDSSVTSANVPYPSGTITQYTDMPFGITKAGTLYVNYHTSNTGGASMLSIDSLKEEMLPSKLATNTEKLVADANDPNIYLEWQLGDTTDGYLKPAYTFRVTTAKKIAKEYLYISTDDDVRIYTVVYNADGTVNKTISWGQSIVIQEGAIFSITIRKNPEDGSVTADVDEMLSHINYIPITKCGSYNIYYDYPTGSNKVYGVSPRVRTDRIKGISGRISVYADDGYRSYLRTFNSDDTYEDSNWVTGNAEYALELNHTYEIWLRNKSNNTIDVVDASNKVAINTLVEKLPDVVQLNEEQLPYVQQLFGGRPTLLETDHELAFIHFSDVHRKQNNWDRVMQFAKHYKDYFQFVIHTGDMVASDQNGYTDLYENGYSADIPTLNVVGNHDIYTDFGSRTIAAKSVTKGLVFPYTSDWDVTWGTDNNPMNFYKDFATEKIRLIVLDYYYDTESQTTWLATVLDDAKELGYSVITATHEVTRPLTTFVDCTFNSLDIEELTAETGINHSASPYDAVIKTFKDGGGKHICNICGHEHIDIMGFTSNGVLNVAIGASLGYDDTSSDVVRIKNTRTWDLFNAVSVNADLGLLKIVRIGANTDHYLRGRNVLCYDYVNNEVISNF